MLRVGELGILGSGDYELMALTEREKSLIDFERNWWTDDGHTTKQEAIANLLKMSSTRYYTLLDQLLDNQEALSYDPLLVLRLRKKRDARRRAMFTPKADPRTHWTR